MASRARLPWRQQALVHFVNWLPSDCLRNGDGPADRPLPFFLAAGYYAADALKNEYGLELLLTNTFEGAK